MSKTIAFIGLGIMGLPMAKNLVSAGFTVRGFNRTPAKAEALAEAGGQAAATIAEAVDGADVIITMVPDSPDVENVLRSEEHTSELQSRGHLVCRLLLEKKKNT